LNFDCGFEISTLRLSRQVLISFIKSRPLQLAFNFSCDSIFRNYAYGRKEASRSSATMKIALAGRFPFNSTLLS